MGTLYLGAFKTKMDEALGQPDLVADSPAYGSGVEIRGFL